jgi:hypothetical protein
MTQKSKLLRRDAVLSEDYWIASLELQLVHLISLTANPLSETALWNSLRKLGYNKKDFPSLSAGLVLNEHFDNRFREYLEKTGLTPDAASDRLQSLWSGWSGAR